MQTTNAHKEGMKLTSSWNIWDLLSKGVFMVGVFVLATAARGEWFLVATYLGKDFLRDVMPTFDVTVSSTSHLRPLSMGTWFKDLPIYVAFAVLTSFCTFWGIGMSFDFYFYKNRKDKPEQWKCQPDRWLTKSNEWHEFLLGSTNMLIGSVASGFISCYIMNGGKCTLYTRPDEYGWAYLLLSAPALFFYNEAVSYYPHRMFHTPFLYRHVHKVHHRYGSPTLYSTTAMHTLEFLVYQTLLALPVFVVPLHAVVFVPILLYGYYYGMMDHSGIKMDAVWPWQPSSMFHDDHHRHFHCNFGFNTILFDRFHGTLRRTNRKYGETVFGGKGKTEFLKNNQSEFITYSTSSIVPFK
ncbi:uncharacterized protein LOC127873877 [Dreissena polymorpha]|uniref:Fatty acid hydroxylase domain-containing protein n=1 Tax=Dreissena polymorpha TaxID=45954 RepID=A0A9D4MIA0_DREPO|nr:uncharacterized protein LOC127873877 [Dreissena polymorpha]KAH3878107.1 hypothetical protein DPMN_001991 [Dreissena polymorpha]